MLQNYHHLASWETGSISELSDDPTRVSEGNIDLSYDVDSDIEDYMDLVESRAASSSGDDSDSFELEIEKMAEEGSDHL